MLDATSENADGAPRVTTPADTTALLALAQKGDVAAFEGLVEQNRDRVYGVALRMLNSPDDAAEVTQDAFISAYRNLPQFRGEAQFSSWVHKIAANYALMRLRHRKVVSAVESPIEDLQTPEFNERGSLTGEIPSWTKGAEEQALDAELRTAIERAAAGLADEYREVFVLRDLEGLSYEEIAELTHSSVAAIKSRLHRARLSLRAAIDHFYEDVT